MSEQFFTPFSSRKRLLTARRTLVSAEHKVREGQAGPAAARKLELGPNNSALRIKSASGSGATGANGDSAGDADKGLSEATAPPALVEALQTTPFRS